MIDLLEFGKRVQIVRDKVMGMTQMDLAVALGTSQAIVSRLESGLGASVDILFKVINLMNEKKIPAHFLFVEPFNLANFERIKLQKNTKAKSLAEIQKRLKELKSNNQKEYQLLTDISLMLGE